MENMIQSLEKAIIRLAEKFRFEGWIKDYFSARRFVSQAKVITDAINRLGSLLAIEVGLVIVEVVERPPVGSVFTIIHPRVYYGTEMGLNIDYQEILEEYGEGLYDFEIERLISLINDGKLEKLYSPAGVIHTHPLPPWFNILSPKLKDTVLRRRHLPSPPDIKFIVEDSLLFALKEHLYETNQVLITVCPATRRKSALFVFEEKFSYEEFLEKYESITGNTFDKLQNAAGDINTREEIVLEWSRRILELFISCGGIIEEIE